MSATFCMITYTFIVTIANCNKYFCNKKVKQN